MKTFLLSLIFLSPLFAKAPYLAFEIHREIIPSGKSQSIHGTCGSKTDRACSLWLERDGARILEAEVSYRFLSNLMGSTPEGNFRWEIDRKKPQGEILKLETVLLYRLRHR